MTGLPRKTYGRQRAGNLTWCLGKSREPPWSFGKRDPTNFRRVISRHRGGATHFVALFSRVRALHVQYWLPQSSRRMAIRTPSASQSGQNHPRPEPQVIRAPLISALYAIERLNPPMPGGRFVVGVRNVGFIGHSVRCLVRLLGCSVCPVSGCDQKTDREGRHLLRSESHESSKEYPQDPDLQ